MYLKTNHLFFFKIFLFVLVLTSIGYFVKGLIEKNSLQKTSDIPFLAVSDKKVDSILSILSLDQKISLVFKCDSSFNENDINPFYLELGQNSEDTLLSYNLDTLNRSKSVTVQEFINSNDVFKQISGNEYLHAIKDTSFIINYLKSRAARQDSLNFYFRSILISNSELFSFPDSTYLEFFKNRLNLNSRIFRENTRLLGFQLSAKNLKVLDSLNANMPNVIGKFYHSLFNKTDFVFIDSLINPSSFVYSFKGLCVSRLTAQNLYNDETLIELLNKEIDLYLVQESEYQKYKDKAIELIKSGKYDVTKLNHKLKKILKAKIWSVSNIVNTGYVEKQPEAVWHQQLVERSICLLNNPDSLLPIKQIDNRTFTVVWIGKAINKVFMQYCNQYAPVTGILLKPGENNWNKKLGKPSRKNLSILVLDSALVDSIDIKQFSILTQLLNKSELIFINFKNYQNLKYISDSIACIQIQSNSQIDYKFAAQSVFGGISIQGYLPYKVNELYPFAKGLIRPKTRLKYGLPGTVGVDAEKLNLIDQIALEGISAGAFPGCQIFVAKDGEVIYDKSFGYHSWSKDLLVKPDDVYDLASVTKISATTIAAMKMISDHKMSLNDPLGKFFKNTSIDYTRIKPDTLIKIDTFLVADIENWKKFLKQNDTLNINDSSFITVDTIITKLTPKLNIFKVPLVDLLMHKSGIIPATPIFRYMYYREYFIKQLKQRIISIQGKTGLLFDFNTFDLPVSFPDNTNLNDSLKQKIKQGFKNQYDEYFSTQFVKDSSDKVRLTKNLYLKNRYFDTIWRDTKQMPVYSKKVFQYSDVNMILLQLAIDSVNRSSIDEYMKKSIYNSLGLRTITYLPLKYYSETRIIPTEMDDSWRYGYLHGYVHDPSSSLMGGMVGNAGLYSNAHDLGVLFQMILNQGKYGGIQYINASVIQEFTKRNDETQRGLGFDMPNMKAAVGKKASKKTYGHTGYTGTCVWVDPESNLVYVFLSNRNNPSSKNWKLTSHKIRERIHDAIYDALIKNE